MPLHVSRRNALLGASATLAALSVPAPVLAEPALLHVSTVAIFDVAKYYAADAQGYFAAENLAVTTEPVQSGAAGQSALMKRRGDAIRSGKDLEGKTVGVNGVRGINWVLTRSWVKLTGGDPEKVSFLELPNSVLIDSIKAKRIDAAYVVDPYMTVGRTDPDIEGFGWPQSSVYRGGVNGLWVVTRASTDQRPDVIRAFVRALIRGAGWVNANLGNDSYFKLVSGFTKIDPAIAAKMVLEPASTSISATQIQPMVKLMRDNGLIAGDIDLRTKMFV
jgi:NitT/TauT family transport system substrate-binding protein